MNNVKKTIMLLSAFCLLSCTACSGDKNEANGSFTDPTPAQQTTAETAAAATATLSNYALDNSFNFKDITIGVSSKWRNEKYNGLVSAVLYDLDTKNYLSFSGMTFNSGSDTEAIFENMYQDYNQNNEMRSYKLTYYSDILTHSYDYLSDQGLNSRLVCFLYNNCIYELTFNGDNMINNYESIMNTMKFNVVQPTETPTEKPTEPVTTKKETKAYNSGVYKVGKDIPEGEYILFNTSDRSAYMCVSSDANQNDITFNENFEGDLIITVYEDEYLELSRCMAVDLDELTEGNEDKAKKLLDALPYGVDNGAMYKVGLMLEPGEYRLENTGSRSAYYCIYSDSRHRDIISNDNFETNAYVDVSDGEYLLLSRCKIVE